MSQCHSIHTLILFTCKYNTFSLSLSLFAFSVVFQKRLKKERRARRRLADQLEMESKRRTQFEEALKSTSSETFRVISGASSHSFFLMKSDIPLFLLFLFFSSFSFLIRSYLKDQSNASFLFGYKSKIP